MATDMPLKWQQIVVKTMVEELGGELLQIIWRRDTKLILKTLTEVACTVHSYFIGYFRDIIFSFWGSKLFRILHFLLPWMYSFVESPVSFIFRVERRGRSYTSCRTGKWYRSFPKKGYPQPVVHFQWIRYPVCWAPLGDYGTLFIQMRIGRYDSFLVSLELSNQFLSLESSRLLMRVSQQWSTERLGQIRIRSQLRILLLYPANESLAVSRMTGMWLVRTSSLVDSIAWCHPLPGIMISLTIISGIRFESPLFPFPTVACLVITSERVGERFGDVFLYIFIVFYNQQDRFALVSGSVFWESSGTASDIISSSVCFVESPCKAVGVDIVC